MHIVVIHIVNPNNVAVSGGKKSAKFVYTTLSPKIFGSNCKRIWEMLLAFCYRTTSRKTRVVAPEMFGLTCRVGAHSSSYAHDTLLYPNSLTFTPLSIARYSFIQLSERGGGVSGENENDQSQTCHLVRIVRIQYGFWPFLR